MVEQMRKVEIVASERQSIEVAEQPGKHTVRIRIAAPGEWASISLTREQWEALCELRYELEVK